MMKATMVLLVALVSVAFADDHVCEFHSGVFRNKECTEESLDTWHSENNNMLNTNCQYLYNKMYLKLHC